MPNYRRAFRPGGTLFFTLVTYRRAGFLCDDLARTLRSTPAGPWRRSRSMGSSCYPTTCTRCGRCPKGMPTSPRGGRGSSHVGSAGTPADHLSTRPDPIKHRLVQCAHEWPWSSFHRLVRSGVYDATWCCGCDGRAPVTMPDFAGLDTEGIEAAFGE